MSPLATETKPNQLPYPNALRKSVLEALAEYYVLTIKDLVQLFYGGITESRETSMRRATSRLERDAYINRMSYCPDDYPGYGTLPLACGLSFEGLCWAQENCAWADPKELIKDHSPLTIEHEIKRARFHMKVVGMCEEHHLELFWKKTDLNHTVKPLLHLPPESFDPRAHSGELR